MNRKQPVPPVPEDPTPAPAPSAFLNRPEFSLPAKTKRTRRTFYLLVLLAVLLVLAGVGFAGYRYKMGLRSAHQAAQSSASAGASAQHAAASQQYLTIKEWGVKLPLSDAIKDAYYFPDVSSVDKNGVPNAMWLASKSLTSATCDPNEPTLAGKGVIGRFMRDLPTDVDGVTGNLMTQEYTNGVTIGGYYYFYDSWARELTCVPVTTTQPIDAALAGAAEGVVNSGGSSSNPYSGWKTYASAPDHIVISYPSTWVLNTKNAQYHEADYDSVTFASPSGTVLNVRADTGGKGGACPPASQDVPFAKGNNCSTLEYLSSEDLHLGGLLSKVEIANTNPVQFDTRPAPAYLITTHYADNNGVQSYGIGIGEPTSGDSFPLNKPLMGGYPSYSWLTVYNSHGQFLPYIYVYANSGSPSFLTSGDAATVKNIIRSFRLNV